MWWSARAKQAANKEHSRNFEAGRVEVTERALHRTGLRGRKIFIYGFVLLLLFIVTLGNLVITAYILGALYFTAGGPSALEYSGESIVFRQDTTANRVQLQGDILSPGVGRLGVSGSSQGVCLQGGNYRNTPFGGDPLPPSQVVANSNGDEGLSFQPYSSLHLLTTNGEEVVGLSKGKMASSGPQNVASLTVDNRLEVDTINLASPASVSSDGMLTLSGSRRVNASVSGSVRLSSTNGDIVLSAKAVEIPAITRRSTIDFRAGSQGVRLVGSTSGTSDVFILCVCGNGRLFRVQSTTVTERGSRCAGHGEVVCLQ